MITSWSAVLLAEVVPRYLQLPVGPDLGLATCCAKAPWIRKTERRIQMIDFMMLGFSVEWLTIFMVKSYNLTIFRFPGLMLGIFFQGD